MWGHIRVVLVLILLGFRVGRCRGIIRCGMVVVVRLRRCGGLLNRCGAVGVGIGVGHRGVEVIRGGSGVGVGRLWDGVAETVAAVGVAQTLLQHAVIVADDGAELCVEVAERFVFAHRLTEGSCKFGTEGTDAFVEFLNLWFAEDGAGGLRL